MTSTTTNSAKMLLAEFRRLAKSPDKATLLRTEDLMVNGKAVHCYVVETKGSPPRTDWIDAQRFLVWREDNATSRVLFTTISLNEALPADTFHFTPPAGATPMRTPR